MLRSVARAIELRHPSGNFWALNKFATQAAPSKTENGQREISLENARPFADIPGPGKLELIRGVLPGGAFYKKSIFEMITMLTDKYGKFMRLPGMFGQPDTYITLNPDDFPIIFRNEGVWPERRNFDSVLYYRQVHRKDFFEGMEGIIAAGGEKWSKMRTAVNPILMQPKNVMAYLDAMWEVNDEFLMRVREIRDPITKEMPESFEDEILRLALESVAMVALNTQLGLIRKNRDSKDAAIITHSVRRFFELAYELDVQPSFWKIVKTPKFYEQMNTLDALLDMSRRYIDNALAKIEKESKNVQAGGNTTERSVLERLSEIDKKFAVIMALDLIFAGVDTTTSTLSGILLCIAKNPEKQQRLFEEMKGVMPTKDTRLTVESMRNLPYLRACIKEGIRIYPIIPGTMRKMPVDVVLSGFRVEKGTEIAIGANLLLSKEEFVPKANQFVPERWLRSEKDMAGAITNPFMYVPFGFGPRSCAGKRIVELELEISIARLVRNFKIEFNYPSENAFRAKFINVPCIPLKFKMEERSD